MNFLVDYTSMTIFISRSHVPLQRGLEDRSGWVVMHKPRARERLALLITSIRGLQNLVNPFPRRYSPGAVSSVINLLVFRALVSDKICTAKLDRCVVTTNLFNPESIRCTKAATTQVWCTINPRCTTKLVAWNQQRSDRKHRIPRNIVLNAASR
jgi:hypothetical protein